MPSIERSNLKLTATYDALIKLLHGKSLENISVSELCRVAQVSRTYYYNHFATHDDLISEFMTLKIVHYLRELPKDKPFSLTVAMTNYFKLAKKAHDSQMILINIGKEQVLIKAFETAHLYLLKNGKIEQTTADKRLSQDYWVEFMAGAVINMSVKWLKNGMPHTPEYMGSLVSQYMFND